MLNYIIIKGSNQAWLWIAHILCEYSFLCACKLSAINNYHRFVGNQCLDILIENQMIIKITFSCDLIFIIYWIYCTEVSSPVIVTVNPEPSFVCFDRLSCRRVDEEKLANVKNWYIGIGTNAGTSASASVSVSGVWVECKWNAMHNDTLSYLMIRLEIFYVYVYL